MPITSTSLQIRNLKCQLFPGSNRDRVIYMIYPEIAGMLGNLLNELSASSNIPIVMINVPSGDWNNYLTPWPEPGEAKGFPPFAGEAKVFLQVITDEIIPQTDKALAIHSSPQRDLMGVSLSGLFTLWTWLQNDIFHSIASLSGSFWYAGFMDWFNQQTIPNKSGKAYFLLGRDEPHASIKAYRSVGTNTQAIVERLKENDIPVTFQWVPGNHFADPEGRAKLGFSFLAADLR